jgi:hypothetical protein
LKALKTLKAWEGKKTTFEIGPLPEDSLNEQLLPAVARKLASA